MTRATSVIDDCINKWKIRGKTKKNEPKREKRDTAESILVQKSGPALAVLSDRRRRPCKLKFSPSAKKSSVTAVLDAHDQ